MEVSPAATPPTRHPGLLVLLIAVAITGLYLLTFNGTFRVDDEHILAARTQSLALWGEWGQPQVYGNLRVRELEAMGPAATQIEPLQAILGAGLMRLGNSIGVGGGQAAFMLNLYATAATASLVALAVLLLRMPTATALWTAALYGAGTMAWPYATTYFRDPLAAVMTAAALLGWILTIQAGPARRRIAGGVILVLAGTGAVLSKNTAMALVLSFALAVAVIVARTRNKAWMVGAGFAVLAVVLVAAFVPADGPLARFSLGYLFSLARHFAGSLDLGLIPAVAGPFLSPAKSIFLFSPPLLLVLVCPETVRRIDWRILLVLISFPLLLALGQALFYRQLWAGVFGWGLRFMLPALPALMVMAAPAIDRLQSDSRRGRWILIAFGAVGIVVQAGGALIPWQRIYVAWEARGWDPFVQSAAWDWRFLAIPGQIRELLSTTSWDTAWLRLTRSGSLAGSWVTLGAACVLILGLVALIALTKRVSVSRTMNAVVGLASAVAFSVPLVALRPALADPGVYGDRLELQAALEWMEPQLVANDTVVVDAYGMPLWVYMMNRWDSSAHWYSLPFDIPGTEAAPEDPQAGNATSLLLTTLAGSGGRIWYVTSDEAPDYAVGSEVAWLDAHTRPGARRDFSGVSHVEVRLYLPSD